MATRWAEESAVEEAATGRWSSAQIACRLDGHHWPSPGNGRTRLVLVERYGGALVVRQECARRCGVRRIADMNMQGYMLTRWKLDYSSDAAKQYLLHDANGKSIGRVNVDGKAAIRRTWLLGVEIVDREERDGDA